jgi:hypothetical protein
MRAFFMVFRTTRVWAKLQREMRSRKIRNRAPAYVPFPIPGMGPHSTRNMKKKMCFFDLRLRKFKWWVFDLMLLRGVYGHFIFTWYLKRSNLFAQESSVCSRWRDFAFSKRSSRCDQPNYSTDRAWRSSAEFGSGNPNHFDLPYLECNS